jgi:Zn-dependent protease
VLAFFIQNLFEPEKQLYFGCVVVTVIISIVLHELAHGWAAIWQGDDTPRMQGHMTPNPMVHMGGFSLLMLALVGIAFGAMPVNPRNFRSRYGDALVSAAGPAMNLLLAFIALTALAVWFKTTGGMARTGTIHNAQEFLWIFGYFNIALALFNLVPVPPLDGSRILGNFVPIYGRWVDNLGSPMILFFIFFMVLLNAPEQYHPFTIAAKAARAYLSIFSSFLPG